MNIDITARKKLLIKLMEEKSGLKENGKYTDAAEKELSEYLRIIFPELKIVETYKMTSSSGHTGTMYLCKLDNEILQIMLTEKKLMFIPIPQEYMKPNAGKSNEEEKQQEIAPVKEIETEPEEEHEKSKDFTEIIEEEQESLPFIDEDFTDLADDAEDDEFI